MATSLVFQICTGLIFIAWAILMIFPYKAWRNKVIPFFVIGISIVYTIYTLTWLPSFNPMSYLSLEGVQALFTNDAIALSGWVHYLAFDLFVGNWVVNKCVRYKVPQYLMVPLLFFCFMFLPMGFLMYLGVQAFYKNKTSQDNALYAA
jgi:hypothetical protein